MERNLYKGFDPTGTIGFDNARKHINKKDFKERQRQHHEQNSHTPTLPCPETPTPHTGNNAHYALRRSQKSEIHSLEIELAQLRAQRKAKAITSIDYELGQTGLAQRLQNLKETLGHDPIRPMKQFTKHGIPRVEIHPIK